MRNNPQSAEQAFLSQHGGNVPDLSQLRTPQYGGARNPITGMSNSTGAHDPGQLTPTEENLCIAAQMRLNERWLAKTYDDDAPDRVWDSFANEARNEFGKIGFVIDIMWSEMTADGLPGKAAIPQITIMGRTDAHAGTDHDLIKREVAAGLKDGKAGYVREDGTWHEDQLRKQI